MKIYTKKSIASPVPLPDLPVGEVGISETDQFYMRIHTINLTSEECAIGINLGTGQYVVQQRITIYRGPNVIHLPNATLIPDGPI